MIRLFGTDGIRGTVNDYPMTPENVLKVGMAVGKVLFRKGGRNTILIGKDTRLSGYIIECALTSGLCSMGINVTLVGPIPTPGIALLTRALRLDAGIVISASHNPFQDNGIKFFSAAGFKLPNELEESIEALVLDDKTSLDRPKGGDIGKAFRLDDAIGRYVEYIKSTIPRNVNLEEFKIVVDSANGAAYKVTPAVLSELGADVVNINDDPDGLNINADCGSLHLNNLRDTVIKQKAHVGIAHDGDADRVIFCDSEGSIVDGDMIMAILARKLKENGCLKNNTVVSTVMSNLGFEHYLLRHGISLVRTKVGDRYVVEKMLKEGHNLGGEQSGHIISLDHNTTGDGPITALQTLYVMKESGKSLSELTEDITLYPQILKNVKVSTKKDINSIPGIKDAIKLGESRLDNKGRILVRPSGTEPKIRVMVEGPDEALISDITNTIIAAVQRSMA